MELFDISHLDDNEVGHLEFVMNSPSWDTVFVPYLRGVRAGAIRDLLDPAEARKAEKPDDFLRGCILTVDGLLHFAQRLISETQHERVARIRELSPEEQHAARVLDGRIGPAGQTTDLSLPDADEY